MSSSPVDLSVSPALQPFVKLAEGPVLVTHFCLERFSLFHDEYRSGPDLSGRDLSL